MTDRTAFVGDVHGCLSAVLGLFRVLDGLGNPHVVFLGDYVNKGEQSAEVMQELVERSSAGDATLLRGNHEEAMLDALDTADLAAFLKIGGAMTIRAYTGGDVGPDVYREFRDSVPDEHLNALRQMPVRYLSGDVVAQHGPAVRLESRYRISAHVPVGKLPRVGPRSAHLDTGCGEDGGRLTALLWPSRNYVQVDGSGAVVVS